MDKWFQLRLPGRVDRVEVDRAESVVYGVWVGWRVVNVGCWLWPLFLLGRWGVCRCHCFMEMERLKIPNLGKALDMG